MQLDELHNTMVKIYWARLADFSLHDDEISNYNGNLYHYTSPYGLLGILENQKIWATESSYLNDSQEIKYGINFAIEKLKETPTSEPWIYDLVESTITRINDFNKKSNIYVACFCENGDLLSQWKGYTNFGTGYSIGFNASELLRTKRKFPHFATSIRKVIYDRKEQENIIKSEIEAVLQKTGSLLSEHQAHKDEILKAATSYLNGYLSTQIVRFKSDVFQEEREWRASIYFEGYRVDLKKQQPKFRVSGDYMVPYIELDIGASAGKKEWFLPISEIIVGAKIDYARAEKAINLIYENLSTQPPAVRMSNILLQ